ncbi:hypothetical protein BDA99DRAFT_535402 [Phascolomyces articulosus]|uniref:Uncharacterized protein n=1 Tax=Phascolomyces articulosus TaxID=60185 RepID=A0AAD5KGB7_9FUNG|nr:hypothetical protein BDA99DRAFT_535402 [Phascolomyces articulosus]
MYILLYIDHKKPVLQIKNKDGFSFANGDLTDRAPRTIKTIAVFQTLGELNPDESRLLTILLPLCVYLARKFLCPSIISIILDAKDPCLNQQIRYLMSRGIYYYINNQKFNLNRDAVVGPTLYVLRPFSNDKCHFNFCWVEICANGDQGFTSAVTRE